MSYPEWPADLPKPERDSYQLQPQDARRKRGFENGPPGYRRRFSAVARMVSLSCILSDHQRTLFDDFYHDDCVEGSTLFWMPDPTRDGWPLLDASGVQLTDELGTPLLIAARWLCSWGDQTPIETIQGIEFRKQFQVVVMP